MSTENELEYLRRWKEQRARAEAAEARVRELESALQRSRDDDSRPTGTPEVCPRCSSGEHGICHGECPCPGVKCGATEADEVAPPALAGSAGSDTRGDECPDSPHLPMDCPAVVHRPEYTLIRSSPDAGRDTGIEE